MATVETPATTLTIDDLLALPDDGTRYELDRGRLVCLPMSNFNSSRLAARISRILGNFVEAHGLGEMSGADGAYVLQPDLPTVRIPDVAFVSRERLPSEEVWSRFLQLAPDLAVEVLSPSDSASEVNAKIRDYLDAGTRLVWVVDPPQRMVTVYGPDRHARILTVADTLDGGDVLPGFELPLRELFG